MIRWKIYWRCRRISWQYIPIFILLPSWKKSKILRTHTHT